MAADIIDFGLHHRPADPTEHIRVALEQHGRISEQVTDIAVSIDVWLRCAHAAAADLGRTVDARHAGAWVWAELRS
ncbi:hypothetical protein [Curtobacterium sp. MCSS17_016]|uniref:hypothetical protein n=1 Tax=Curtobacterium sp. MCSS17_016 TaxID=2175644 RepID=UPI0011B6E6BE|nr:hypothetical protein [Curtobacterium sp. MCSS17_016]WIE80996.1 hypothetical protein DEJ19_020990 [Curtobacterium sp. MCSS17_016]